MTSFLVEAPRETGFHRPIFLPKRPAPLNHAVCKNQRPLDFSDTRPRLSLMIDIKSRQDGNPFYIFRELNPKYVTQLLDFGKISW
jgi:hypothetical protein